MTSIVENSYAVTTGGAMSGPTLRELRKSASLTQTELAALLGCQQRQISLWENGFTKINKMKEIAICAILFNDTIPSKWLQLEKENYS